MKLSRYHSQPAHRSRHRLYGWLLLLPLLVWATTGIFFQIKPGYDQAYERLVVRNYPLGNLPPLQIEADWLEVRRLRTLLGEHLLVRSSDKGWRQLQPDQTGERNLPDAAQVQSLVEDAMAANPARYGHIRHADGSRFETTTGVVIELDWHSLGLSQRGRDTRLIDRLYSLHYLNWTGIPMFDRILSLLGLGLLLTMTYSGARLLLRTARPKVREQKLLDPGTPGVQESL